MKRKILLLFAAFLLGMALSACGSDIEEKQENKNTGGTAQENENIEETTLDDLESYLLEQGVLSGKRTEVDAEKIMAEAGFAYKDSNVEIYEFAPGSSVYDALAVGGCIGFDNTDPISAETVNGKYVMIATGEVSAELRDAFGSFAR